MPQWLQGIASSQPVTPIIETIRAFLFGTGVGGELGWALAWCGLILAASVAWGAWLFRRRSR